METVGSVTVVAFGIRKMSLVPTVPLRCISSAIVPNYIIFYHKVLGLPYSSSRSMREKVEDFRCLYTLLLGHQTCFI